MTAVANEYGVSISEIKKWNNLKSNMLTYGKSLKIISNQSVVRCVKKESDTDRVSSQAISKNQNVVAYKSKINTISAPLSTDYLTLYVIQKSDSLFSIL